MTIRHTSTSLWISSHAMRRCVEAESIPLALQGLESDSCSPMDDKPNQSRLAINKFNRSQTRDHQGGAQNGGYGVAPGTAATAGAAALGAGALAAGVAYASNRDDEQRPQHEYPNLSRPYGQPPPRDPRHVVNRNQEPDLFIPVTNEGRHQAALDFMPGILRPVSLIIFMLVVLIVLALLLTVAIWSLVHKGAFDYGTFGDGKYFIFEYLPTILGMLVLYWLLQIEVAAYRIAPFIAMASDSPTSWEEGAKLPMYPKTFLIPYFGHFRARQGVMGFFVLACWLQIWTVPLLGTAFNVYFFGSPNTGTWRWTATAGLVWIVIGFYILLIVAVIMLMLWLRRQIQHGTSMGSQEPRRHDCIARAKQCIELYRGRRDPARRTTTRLLAHITRRHRSFPLLRRRRQADETLQRGRRPNRRKASTTLIRRTTRAKKPLLEPRQRHQPRTAQ